MSSMEYILLIAFSIIVILFVAYLIQSARANAYKDAAKRPINITQNANPVINTDGGGGKSSFPIAGVLAIVAVAGITILSLSSVGNSAQVADRALSQVPAVASVPTAVVAPTIEVTAIPVSNPEIVRQPEVIPQPAVVYRPDGINWGAVLAITLMACAVGALAWAEKSTRDGASPILDSGHQEEKEELSAIEQFAAEASDKLERV